MRTAIIHDWLVTFAGAERVLEQLLAIYPDADVFTIVDYLPDADRSFLRHTRVTTSYIQKLPWAKKYYRYYLPLMPLAIEQFDLSGYDLIVSSSHAVAKGVITGADQVHISYVHTPIRYAWDLQHQYLRESGLEKGLKSLIVRRSLHKIRMWDLRTANGVDCFLANSEYIARRIMKVYRRSAEVVYPPVDIDSFMPVAEKDDFFLTASRMVPYKKINLIVEAFTKMPDHRLVVIGDGPDFAKIKAVAGPNVSMLGYQSHDVLLDHMQRAKCFVFAAEEDFGITPVEAMACGTPVIAYGKGGALETVVGNTSDSQPTGVFFDTQSIESLIKAVRYFDGHCGDYLPENCRQRAEQFSNQKFREAFVAALENQTGISSAE